MAGRRGNRRLTLPIERGLRFRTGRRATTARQYVARNSEDPRTDRQRRRVRPPRAMHLEEHVLHQIVGHADVAMSPQEVAPHVIGQDGIELLERGEIAALIALHQLDEPLLTGGLHGS